MAAMAAFTGMSVCIRFASAELHPFQIVFFRNLLVLALMAPFFRRLDLSALRRPDFPWRLYTLRSVFGTVGMICGFWAVIVMPLADVTALSFTMPLFATVGAALFLGETVRARRWTAIIVGFLGAMLVLRPDLSGLDAGAGLALTNALMIAASALVLKRLAHREPAERIVFLVSAIIAILSLAPALFVWRWPSWEIWFVLVALAGVASLGHLAFVRALFLADLTVVMPWEFTRLPMMVLVAMLVFGETPSVWALAGGAVIFASTFYIVQREAQLARRPESR
ncbi:MAG: DMT family transporter [Alphaproteobacteria bacterium]|nr:DMT family transporter [Alphaproteobacteria bacterium]MCY4231542.1 DMT family transporter [Alphaproteobacteria bacterium]MCY4317931.1 DMT family transporter [Alphaproteobacteria bacterium]